MQPLTLGFEQALRGAQCPVQCQQFTAVVLRDFQWVEPGVFGDQPAFHVRHQLLRGAEDLS
ncbi:hypothetical protein D3C85_1851810 [compost metagenome]